MPMVVLVFAVFWLAYLNGVIDNSKGVATLYGSGTVTYRTALIWTTVAPHILTRPFATHSRGRIYLLRVTIVSNSHRARIDKRC